MKLASRFCPDHPQARVRDYQSECSYCNKPLQFREDAEKPPAAGKEVGKVPPMVGGWNSPPDKKVVETLPAPEKMAEQPASEFDAALHEKILTDPPRPFKEFREKIEAKIKDKVEPVPKLKVGHKPSPFNAIHPKKGKK